MIPAEAVEAAARAMAPAVWGPSVWQFAAHGESPAGARNRVQQESLQDARRALEAAAPYLMAEAFDQGQKSGIRHADRLVAAAKIGRPELPGPISPNPYRRKSS